MCTWNVLGFYFPNAGRYAYDYLGYVIEQLQEITEWWKFSEFIPLLGIKQLKSRLKIRAFTEYIFKKLLKCCFSGMESWSIDYSEQYEYKFDFYLLDPTQLITEEKVPMELVWNLTLTKI